jgi:2-oxoglutarate dehydrogenase E2 component (dihydrolipoamide succinyltransferase)
VRVGDRVATGEPLVIVETNKIDTEVPSPVSGVVTEILVSTGDEPVPGSGLCVIES